MHEIKPSGSVVYSVQSALSEAGGRGCKVSGSRSLGLAPRGLLRRRRLAAWAVVVLRLLLSHLAGAATGCFWGFFATVNMTSLDCSEYIYIYIHIQYIYIGAGWPKKAICAC